MKCEAETFSLIFGMKKIKIFNKSLLGLDFCLKILYYFLKIKIFERELYEIQNERTRKIKFQFK